MATPRITKRQRLVLPVTSRDLNLPDVSFSLGPIPFVMPPAPSGVSCLSMFLWIVSFVVEMVQLSFFALRIVSLNLDLNVERPDWVDWIDASLLPYVFVDFTKVDPGFVRLWIGFAGAVLLILLFVGQMIIDVTCYEATKLRNELGISHSGCDDDDGDRHQADDADGTFFHSFTGSLLYGHGKPKNLSSLLCFAVQALCDILFFTMLSALSSSLSCFRSDDASVRFSSSADIECWSGYHQATTIAGLIGFGFFVPLSIMVAPVVATASASGPGTIETSKAYTMVVNCLKVVAIVVAVLSSFNATAGLVSAGLMTTGIFALTTGWGFATGFTGPLINRPSMGLARAIGALCTVLCTIVAILALTVPVPIETLGLKYILSFSLLAVFGLAVPHAVILCDCASCCLSRDVFHS